VFAMVRELAEEEKLAGEVGASAAMLGGVLFCARPFVFCDIAEWRREPVGFALWFRSFSTFSGRAGVYLEDLYVRPTHRRRGVGRALLAHLAARCVEDGCSRLQWSVLDWNAPAIAFYKALGAVLIDEWTTCRIHGDALRRLAIQAPALAIATKD